MVHTTCIVHNQLLSNMHSLATIAHDSFTSIRLTYESFSTSPCKTKMYIRNISIESWVLVYTYYDYSNHDYHYV